MAPANRLAGEICPRRSVAEQCFPSLKHQAPNGKGARIFVAIQEMGSDQAKSDLPAKRGGYFFKIMFQDIRNRVSWINIETTPVLYYICIETAFVRYVASTGE